MEVRARALARRPQREESLRLRWRSLVNFVEVSISVSINVRVRTSDRAANWNFLPAPYVVVLNRPYFLVALAIDQDVNCGVTERNRAPIAMGERMNVSIRLADLGGADLEKRRRRQGRSRPASASDNSSNSNNKGFSNNFLLIRVRCRSARARPVLPGHCRC